MMRLSEFVTTEHPLGPLDQLKLEEPADSAAVLDTAEPLLAAHKRHYTLIYGRKGSGKTSIMSSYQCFMHLRKRHKFPSFINPQPDLHDYVVSIKAWDRLREMAKSVFRGVVPYDLRVQSEDLLLNTPVENIANAWTDVIWEEIYKHFYTLYRNGGIKDRHVPKSVVSYFEQFSGFDLTDDPKSDAKNIFDTCKEEVTRYLDSEKRQVLVLFDTMEEYPILNPLFLDLLGGLVRAISRFHVQTSRVHVIFSLPEELVEFFRDRSSNLLKDFETSYAIRWKPIDLLRIVAHRYRLFLALNSDQSFKAYEKLDLNHRDDVRNFYSNWLPDTVKNDFGGEEDSLAYIARHTHLLPRHMLALFDQITIETQKITGGYKRLDSDAIKLGVQQKEGWIAEEVLVPFKFIYKDVRKHLKAALQSLKPVFKYGELQRHCPRLRKEYGWDQDELMEKLYHMGVIGRVTAEGNGGGKSGGRYTYADFYFNKDGGMGFAHDAEYCIHPLFSKLFGCDLNRKSDHRMIYPNNVILVA